MRKRNFSIFVLFVVAIVAVGGCSDDPVTPPPNPTGTVIFNFDHEVDGTPVLMVQELMTDLPYTNAMGQDYNITELEYFVTNFRVHKANGTTFGKNDVHFRELLEPTPPPVSGAAMADEDETRSYSLSNVPAGTYNAVSFTFGLDAEINFTNSLVPFNIFRLEWPESWGGGYHYMEMNGFYDDGTTTEPYETHAGRRYLTDTDPLAVPQGPDIVEHHHFFQVYLSVPPFFVADGDSWEVTTIMNINGWYQDPLIDLSDYFPAPGSIMINLDAQALLMQNGMNNVYRVLDPVKK